jgi:hypothetical protein
LLALVLAWLVLQAGSEAAAEAAAEEEAAEAEVVARTSLLAQ